MKQLRTLSGTYLHEKDLNPLLYSLRKSLFLFSDICFILLAITIDNVLLFCGENNYDSQVHSMSSMRSFVSYVVVTQ